MKFSCPACKASQDYIRYVQRVVEYHTIEETDGEGNVEFKALEGDLVPFFSLYEVHF
jgi:hypothetical protein